MKKLLLLLAEQGQAIEAAARARASTIVADGEKNVLWQLWKMRKLRLRSKLTALSNLPRRKPMCRFSVRAIAPRQVADLAVQGAEQILAREVDKTVHAQAA